MQPVMAVGDQAAFACSGGWCGSWVGSNSWGSCRTFNSGFTFRGSLINCRLVGMMQWFGWELHGIRPSRPLQPNLFTRLSIGTCLLTRIKNSKACGFKETCAFRSAGFKSLKAGDSTKEVGNRRKMKVLLYQSPTENPTSHGLHEKDTHAWIASFLNSISSKVGNPTKIQMPFSTSQTWRTVLSTHLFLF